MRRSEIKFLFQTVILTIVLFTLLTLNNAFALEGEETTTTLQRIDELHNHAHGYLRLTLNQTGSLINVDDAADPYVYD